MVEAPSASGLVKAACGVYALSGVVRVSAGAAAVAGCAVGREMRRRDVRRIGPEPCPGHECYGTQLQKTGAARREA